MSCSASATPWRSRGRWLADDGGDPANRDRPLLDRPSGALAGRDRRQDIPHLGIPPGEGSDSGIVVVFDETQREHNERVQREFATNAAHELRTPLASIVTAVEMLQTGAKDDGSARDEFLEVIQERPIVYTARPAPCSSSHEPSCATNRFASRGWSWRPLLEQVAASLQVPDGVGISVDCQPALAVATDSDLLEQALSSIAANAVQHGPRTHQPAWLTTQRLGLDRDRRHRTRHPGRAGTHLRALLSGQKQLRGVRTRAVDRSRVRAALGGEITLDPAPSNGTTVRIVLPAGEAE